MSRRFQAGWPAAAAMALVVCLTGCGAKSSEIAEAKELAKVLRSLAPVAQELIEEEHNIANDLKITLEEQDRKSKAPDQAPTDIARQTKEFRDRFSGYIDRMIAMRNKRKDIQARVRQGRWKSPMVFVVQNDAVVQLHDEITRIEAWIELSQNVRLRAELGNAGPYPELGALSKQLGSYLSQPSESPLSSQVRHLMEEYRFGEGDIVQ